MQVSSILPAAMGWGNVAAMHDVQAKQMNKSDDDFSAVLEAVLNSKA